MFKLLGIKSHMYHVEMWVNKKEFIGVGGAVNTNI